jgi:hypothetical protein
VVSTTHAAIAFVQGIYWLAASGELAQLGSKEFVFLPINSHIAAIGGAYFLYDSVAMIISYNTMKPGFFFSIMVHHFIFVAAYASTLVCPVHASAMAAERTPALASAFHGCWFVHNHAWKM